MVKTYLDLTSDTIFKAFMMSEKTREYTGKLIEIITGIPKEEIVKNRVFTNVEIPVRNKKDKKYRTDIIISVDKHMINLEMNRSYYDGLFTKNKAYLNRIYSDQFDSGEDYIEVKKIIGINIDNFTKYEGNKLVYKFMSLEVETKEVEDDNYEIYHIDLEYYKEKCYNKKEQSELEKMLKIFVEEEVKMEEYEEMDEALKNAVDELEFLSSDKKIIGLYDAEVVDRKVWNTKLKYAEKVGTEIGMKKGMEKGMEQGIETVARNLKNTGMPINEIKEVTGLSIKKINEL